MAQITAPGLMQVVESAAPSSGDCDTNTPTVGNGSGNGSIGTVVTRIESIFEAVVSALSNQQELSIRFKSRGSRTSSERCAEQICFPGRNAQDARKFARVLLILQLAHDALVSGTVLTKRHIYYQHQDLFESQRQVDGLVDDIAFNLGVGRSDLCIEATSKGLIAGRLVIRLTDGNCLDPTSGELGIPIPSTRSISHVDFGSARWILIIEKDAVFRSLCATRFWQTAASGPGIIVTAKGYPDLITRSFLSFVAARNPKLPILALVDLDPDGMSILRCYQHGSSKLSHEADACAPSIRWLGIMTRHVTDLHVPSEITEDIPFGRPSPAFKTAVSSTDCRDPITYLTSRDRLMATRILRKLASASHDEADEMRRELQTMLVLGIKAEIEWLDESGNLTGWLDAQIRSMLVE